MKNTLVTILIICLSGCVHLNEKKNLPDYEDIQSITYDFYEDIEAPTYYKREHFWIQFWVSETSASFMRYEAGPDLIDRVTGTNRVFDTESFIYNVSGNLIKELYLELKSNCLQTLPDIMWNEERGANPHAYFHVFLKDYEKDSPSWDCYGTISKEWNQLQAKLFAFVKLRIAEHPDLLKIKQIHYIDGKKLTPDHRSEDILQYQQQSPSK